jgi:hypothetical protein
MAEGLRLNQLKGRAEKSWAENLNFNLLKLGPKVFQGS